MARAAFAEEGARKSVSSVGRRCNNPPRRELEQQQKDKVHSNYQGGKLKQTADKQNMLLQQQKQSLLLRVGGARACSSESRGSDQRG
eukprot:CAMPEP_0183720570 /NCGR_PEP_ID=MMETSP0737-20130205/13148_1 /TAXON_ID=385413 /ORGANISM="Thalassiosira miniscula, Strain CCMP1093" /LENGTH=86 /DNA_ID=CAMNT_0025950451 /DNA_START=146 /DNA_END=402 /DNA_ORIENTATION=-